MPTNDDASAKKVRTISAYPPWHSILALTVITLVFLRSLPSLDQLDDAAKIETFTHVRFPHALDLRTMAYIRMAIAISIWAVLFHAAVISPGWIQQTSYQKESQLKMTPILMSGTKTLAPFTSVSWILLGISFTLSSFIAMKGSHHESVPPWVLRIALCVWEVAAPNSLLVACVIRYAIWPAVLASGTSTANLKSVR